MAQQPDQAPASSDHRRRLWFRCAVGHDRGDRRLDGIGRCGECLGAISTCLLRRVQCAVCRPFQRLCVDGVIWNYCDSDAQAYTPIDHRNADIRNGSSNPFGCLYGAVYVCGRQQDEELLSAVSASKVADTKRVRESGADGGEDVVTSAVPKSVVDLLEMI